MQKKKKNTDLNARVKQHNSLVIKAFKYWPPPLTISSMLCFYRLVDIPGATNFTKQWIKEREEKLTATKTCTVLATQLTNKRIYNCMQKKFKWRGKCILSEHSFVRLISFTVYYVCSHTYTAKHSICFDKLTKMEQKQKLARVIVIAMVKLQNIVCWCDLSPLRRITFWSTLNLPLHHPKVGQNDSITKIRFEILYQRKYRYINIWWR